MAALNKDTDDDVTWYIVTMSPGGIADVLMPDIRRAVEERGIDVKWVYSSPKNLESNDGLKAQWQMLSQHNPDWKTRADSKHLNDRVVTLKRTVKETYEQIAKQPNHAGTLELYESHVPSFYMAFLSVPKKHSPDPMSKSAPVGTFGFVMLYPMFPKDHDSRPAIYLERTDKAVAILDEYYWAIAGLFDEGLNRGYLTQVTP